MESPESGKGLLAGYGDMIEGVGTILKGVGTILVTATGCGFAFHVMEPIAQNVSVYCGNFWRNQIESGGLSRSD